jgi:hypothetical protein
MKDDQLGIPKMGKIMFLIRWCRLFMYARKFYIEISNLKKMGKNLKIGGKLVEETEKCP